MMAGSVVTIAPVLALFLGAAAPLPARAAGWQCEVTARALKWLAWLAAWSLSGAVGAQRRCSTTFAMPRSWRVVRLRPGEGQHAPRCERRAVPATTTSPASPAMRCCAASSRWSCPRTISCACACTASGPANASAAQARRRQRRQRLVAEPRRLRAAAREHRAAPFASGRSSSPGARPPIVCCAAPRRSSWWWPAAAAAAASCASSGSPSARCRRPGPRAGADRCSVSPRHWQVDLGERREFSGLFVRWRRRTDEFVRLRRAAVRRRATVAHACAACVVPAATCKWCGCRPSSRHATCSWRCIARGPGAATGRADRRAGDGPRAVADAERRAGRARQGSAARAHAARLHRRAELLDAGGRRRRRCARGGDLRRRRDRAARGGLRSSRSSSMSDGRVTSWADVAHRPRAARRLPADASGALVAAGPRAVDRSRCRRHAVARAPDRALHAAQHRRRAAPPHAGAGVAAVAGQSAGAVPQHAGRRQSRATARLARRHACRSTGGRGCRR